jgi:hypothetical protein
VGDKRIKQYDMVISQSWSKPREKDSTKAMNPSTWERQV